MTLRIVMLTNAVVEDKPGGLYRYVSELASTLACRGVDVTVLTKRVSDTAPEVEVTQSGVRIERYKVPSKSSRLFAVIYPLAVFWAVFFALRRHKGAVVHAHFPVPALVPLLTGRRYFYTFHAPVHRELLGERRDSYFLPRPLQNLAVACLRRVEARLVCRAERVLLLSEFARREVAMLNGPAARRAHLLAGGVDLDRFTPPDPTKPEEPSKGPLIVVARRLVWRTGVVEAVRAMELVLRVLPAAQLVILGDGLLREEVKKQVRLSGLEEHVSLRGHVSDDELVDWYRRATLVLMPTQALEGFGLASAEAMACGTPVVATPVGANDEVVGSFDSAWIAAGTDPSALAAAIVSVADQAGAGRWSRDGVRAHVAPRFGWDAVADVHIGLYKEVSR